MSKWMIVALILMIVLTACNGLEGERMDDQNVIERQYNYSAEDIYIQDIKLVDFMKLNKEQALEKLGGEYEMVGVADGYEEGYYFPKYFLSVAFDEQGLPAMMRCRRGVDVMGLTLDMSASEVKTVMGEGEFLDLSLTDGIRPFVLVYRYEGFTLRFFLTEEDGDVTGIHIYFFR